MASARLRRREKQLEELTKENVRLHQDVEDLETAFFLHRRGLEEEENSVRGIIRKEVGGSRWEHGGSGKLTTYKSSKDLQSSPNIKSARNTSSGASTNRTTASPERENHFNGNGGAYADKISSKTYTKPLLDKKGKAVKLLADTKLQDVESDTVKLLDLKTKVLKKASSKVIKRDSWGSPSRPPEDKTQNVTITKVTEKAKKLPDKADRINTKTKKIGKQKKENANTVTNKTDKSNSNPITNTNTLALDINKQNKNKDAISSLKTEKFARLSRRDTYKGSDEKVDKAADLQLSSTHAASKTFITDEDYGNLETHEVDDINKTSLHVSKGKFEEATEIFIDPNNAQVRIRYGGSEALKDLSEFKDTKLIQPEVMQKDTVPHKFTYSILEESRNSGNRVRDIFGLKDIGVENELLNGVTTKTTASLSPLALTKDCDTEVEFWLCGLGLTDVEHYVKIFADNDIDLLDLEFMSATQLNEMGVSNTDALNTLLNGIRELKNIPPDKYIKGDTLNAWKGLQASSIAWEDPSNEEPVRDKITSVLPVTLTSEDVSVTGRTDVKSQSNKNKTYVKGRDDSPKTDYVRCGSNISNKSDSSSRSSRNSSRTQNHVDANAQSKASSRMQKSQASNAHSKDVDKYPNNVSSASVKSGSSKSDKLPPNSKPQLQRKTSNASDKRPKTAEPAAENRSRLQALEAKPTRSVLLKRSSSLTRETGRGQNRKGRKGSEGSEKGRGSKGPDGPENRRPTVRARSRSADAVKRKALEGVQAAAKKHEEKQIKNREIEETKHKIQERKKTERDEMAARHLQREKHKVTVVADTLTSNRTDTSPSPDDVGLDNLVTINVLSQSDRKEMVGKSVAEAPDDKSRTRVIVPTPQSRKSLRRIEPAKKSVAQTPSKSWDRLAQSDYEVPLLSTYKLETRNKEGATSEPESGYKTDSSTTYSQVEEKVAEIQLKIKRLKARATSGDEVTLTLVKDLQTELQHFEKLLIEKEKAVRYLKPDKTDSKKTGSLIKNDSSDSKSINQAPETSTPRHMDSSMSRQPFKPSQEQLPKPIPRKASSSSGHSYINEANLTEVNFSEVYMTETNKTEADEVQLNESRTAQKEAVIEDLLSEDSVVKGGEFVTRDKAAMSMSKKELLDEMRKEKHQHHRQIRQLQTELKRMRETDAASSMELNQNDIMYREEDLVGEGTFSQVFRGAYQGSEVAIKRLVMPLASQDRNYFAAEVSLLRELRHPRVVLLIGVCTADRLPLMLLEFMSRGSLYNHLHDARNDTLDHAEFYQVARDIALGMNYLHSHKPEVLHLDLKSMNVLLCQSFRAKIADFGFSKLRHDATLKVNQKSKSRQPRGSPCWMAPELVDKGEITCKADVYSFAIILWEMLTRKMPYENASVFQVLEMVRKNKRPNIPESCPEGLSLLISRCWDQNPAKRSQFKDIIVSLDDLAFPPAWRALFKKAGVPEEALQNIDSTRTLIHLVKTTLDSSSFTSFMIVDSKGDRTSSRDTTFDTSGDTTASTCIQRKTVDEWESDTISEISEIPAEQMSELSLGSLRDSSEESSDETARDTLTENNYEDSSELSSDDSVAVLPLSSQRKSARKKLNVFVPSLELSMKSPVPELAKNDKPTFDWVSISLEDRTDHVGVSQVHSADRQTFDLNLSSSNSCIVTPMSNTSQRSPQTKKTWQEKAREMDEYLMRESIDNRRPSSPVRKRLSLTKKLAERTSKSLDTAQTLGSKSRSLDVDKGPHTERQPRTNPDDLSVLNRKLMELNSMTLDHVHHRPVISDGQFRRVQNEDLDLAKFEASYEPVRVTLNEYRDPESDRNLRSLGTSMGNSYDSFYSLPVNIHPNNTQPTAGSFRKSELVLPRNGSFTKSQDVLNLLENQIKHTTKTLEEMEQDSPNLPVNSLMQNNSTESPIKLNLKQAVGTKQSRDFVEQGSISKMPKEKAVMKKNTNKPELQNKKNNNKQSSTVKTLQSQNSLEEYHRFVHKEILHDSGGSIENIKKSLVDKTDESDTKVKDTGISDCENKNITKEMEPTDLRASKTADERDATVKDVEKNLSENKKVDQEMGTFDLVPTALRMNKSDATVGDTGKNHIERNDASFEMAIDSNNASKEMTRDDLSPVALTMANTLEEIDTVVIDSKENLFDNKNVDEEMETGDLNSTDLIITKTREREMETADLNTTDLIMTKTREQEMETTDLNSTDLIMTKTRESFGHNEISRVENVEILDEGENNDEEEDECIRVILNPSALVNRKPVKTPRKSKLKESEKSESLHNVHESGEVNLINSALNTDFKTHESAKSVDKSKLESKAKLRDNKVISDTINDLEKLLDVVSVPDNSMHVEMDSSVERLKKSNLEVSERVNDLTTEDAKNSRTNVEKKSSAKVDKVKLLPKDEHWKPTPEKSVKPKVTNNAANKTKVTGQAPVKSPTKPKKTIRVKLKKDPLAPVPSTEPASIIPPPPAPPPPPPASLSMSNISFSKTVKQLPRPATSMADELKLRVESWQSKSFHKSNMKSKQEPLIHKALIQSRGFPSMSKKYLDSVAENEGSQLEDSLDEFELSDNLPGVHQGCTTLIPEQSDGLPSFAVQSVELRDQKDHLRSISKPHPDQLDDLSHVSQEQLSSIADLLRKAVLDRRLALGEDSASVDQSMDSVSWSVETTPRP